MHDAAVPRGRAASAARRLRRRARHGQHEEQEARWHEAAAPELRSAFGEDDAALLDEASVEHASVKALVGALENAKPSDELVDARVTVLCEYVRHHVQEEEDEIFPKAKKVRGIDLDSLADRMQQRKRELEARVGVGEDEDDDGSRPVRPPGARTAVGTH